MIKLNVFFFFCKEGNRKESDLGRGEIEKRLMKNRKGKVQKEENFLNNDSLSFSGIPEEKSQEIPYNKGHETTTKYSGKREPPKKVKRPLNGLYFADMDQERYLEWKKNMLGKKERQVNSSKDRTCPNKLRNVCAIY